MTEKRDQYRNTDMDYTKNKNYSNSREDIISVDHRASLGQFIV